MLVGHGSVATPSDRPVQRRASTSQVRLPLRHERSIAACAILMDRIKCVRIDAPTADEKRRIVKERMFPRACAKVRSAFDVNSAVAALWRVSTRAAECAAWSAPFTLLERGACRRVPTKAAAPSPSTRRSWRARVGRRLSDASRDPAPAHGHVTQGSPKSPPAGRGD